jgi:hypothetical protein
VIFTGISALLSVSSSSILLFRCIEAQILQAVQATSASRSAVIDLFERIENFFIRLGTYVELPPTVEMTDIIVKVMVDVLHIFALVTREIKQGKISGLILDDRHSLFNSSFLREILDKVDWKIGYQGCLAKVRQTNARGKSDGGCTRFEGHRWRAK